MGRVKDFDTAEVLNKAMELFWEKGFHATSYHDLVNHLGVHRGSLYATFGDKESLFLKALDLYLQKRSFDPEQLNVLLADISVREFLEKLFEKELYVQEEKNYIGCLLVNATAELANENDKVCDVLDHNMTKGIELFERIFSVALERGEIHSPEQPKNLAVHLFTFLHGLKVIAKLNKPDKLIIAINAELDLIFGPAKRGSNI